MNKHLRVGLLAILLVGCASYQSNSGTQTKSIVVESTAKDCESALRQAKADASDRVSGTFVHGYKKLVQDRDYSEELNEYSSGVVQRYNVLESSGQSPCKVRIEAWVISGSEPILIRASSGGMSVDEINLNLAKIRNNDQFLAQQLRETREFSIELNTIRAYEESPGNLSVSLEVQSIQASQRWLNNLEAFLSIRSQPVVYQKDSRSRSIERLFSFEKSGIKAPPSPSEFEICFAHKQRETVHCYSGEDNRKIIRVLRSSTVELALIKESGGRQNLNASSGRFGFYSYKPMETRYYASGYAPRADFPLVEAWPLPIIAGFYYPGKHLPKDMRISAYIRFTDVNQFPLKTAETKPNN